MQCSMNLELLPERARLTRGYVPCAGKPEQGVTQRGPVLLRKTKSMKEDRLEAPHRMRRRKQVVADLGFIHDRVVTIRQVHGEVVWLTYRRSAAGARGSEATDKPVSCNAKLAGRRAIFDLHAWACIDPAKLDAVLGTPVR
jgi:hypothetical protein